MKNRKHKTVKIGRARVKNGHSAFAALCKLCGLLMTDCKDSWDDETPF